MTRKARILFGVTLLLFLLSGSTTTLFADCWECDCLFIVNSAGVHTCCPSCFRVSVDGETGYSQCSTSGCAGDCSFGGIFCGTIMVTY